ncbi:MAG: hypothetical protein ACK5MZ_09125 [Aestuariibaculum sp.]
MKAKLIAIIFVLFTYSLFGQSVSTKDFQTFNQSSNGTNEEQGGVTVKVYQASYIYDGKAKEQCNNAFSNLPGELKELNNGEYLAFVTKDKIYVFTEEMTFTNVFGDFLKYLKCWVDSDPSGTVEIQ